MRWYVNDASLQGQFTDSPTFEVVLRAIVSARSKSERLRLDLRTTRSLAERQVTFAITLRGVVQKSRDRDLRNAVLSWLDRAGPFVEDDRFFELDDYFEFFGLDVTDTGLGEAVRRAKAGERTCAFSFEGGRLNFATTPLMVDHGLREEPLGVVCVDNLWTVGALKESALGETPPINSWASLVRSARERFDRLLIPDFVYQNGALASEPFDPAIGERAMILFGYLNAYMLGRGLDGTEGPEAKEIVAKFFVGQRALFSPESPTNQDKFRNAMLFPDPSNRDRHIFAHWHGKISRRFFRLHFEWPVDQASLFLKILYLGPKITKS